MDNPKRRYYKHFPHYCIDYKQITHNDIYKYIQYRYYKGMEDKIIVIQADIPYKLQLKRTLVFLLNNIFPTIPIDFHIFFIFVVTTFLHLPSI